MRARRARPPTPIGRLPEPISEADDQPLAAGWGPSVAPAPAAPPPPDVTTFKDALVAGIPDSFFGAVVVPGAPSNGDSKGFFVDLLTAGFADRPPDKRSEILLKLAVAKQGGANPARMMRLVLSELGPGFVKLGQLLGNRPDLVQSAAFREELVQLSDDAPSASFADVEGTINDTLGRPWQQVFASINEKPLKAGSIGQVHLARLKSGEEVVLKIIKPEARALLIDNLSTLVRFVDSDKSPYAKALRGIVAELRRVATAEVDLTVEADAIDEAEKHLESHVGIGVPRVLRRYSGPDMLVESVVPGAKVTDRLPDSGKERRLIAERLFAAVLRQIYVDGFFHADPTEANVFRSGDRLFFLDWGLHGRIAKKDAEKLWDVALGLSTGSVELTAGALSKLSGGRLSVDRTRRLLASVPPSITSFSHRMQWLVLAVQDAGVTLPASLPLAIKALMQAEGVALKIDPGFNSQLAAAATIVGAVDGKAMSSMAVHSGVKVGKLVARHFAESSVRLGFGVAKLGFQTGLGVLGKIVSKRH